MAQVTSGMTEEVQALPSYSCRDWRSASKVQLHLQGLRKCKQDPVTSVETEEMQARPLHPQGLKKCKQGPVTSAGTEEVQARPSNSCKDWRSASKAQLHLQGLRKCQQGHYIHKDWRSVSKAQLHLQRLMKDKHCPVISGGHKYCPIPPGGSEEEQVPPSQLRCSVLYDSFSN